MGKSETQKSKDKFIRSYIFEGIIVTLLGIAMLIWPEWSLRVLCNVLGGVIATMGLIRFAVYLINKDYNHMVYDLIIGLVMICLGLSMIAFSHFFISLFFIVTGVLLIYGSFLMFYRAFMLRRMGGAVLIMSIIFAIITLAFAVVIFLNPAQFAEIITRIQGAALIIEGIGMIIVLRDIKYMLKEEKDDSAPVDTVSTEIEEIEEIEEFEDTKEIEEI